MKLLHNSFEPATYTTKLQNGAYTHAVTDAILKLRFGDFCESALIDFEAACGRSTRAGHDGAHCDFSGQSANKDLS